MEKHVYLCKLDLDCACEAIDDFNWDSTMSDYIDTTFVYTQQLFEVDTQPALAD